MALLSLVRHPTRASAEASSLFLIFVVHIKFYLKILNSGSYECSVAREEDGSIQVLSYTFDVQFPPEVTLESPDLKDGQIVKTAGESFSLTCTVSAKPEATIKWLRDAVEIEDTANKTTISMESTTFADHNGKYECQEEFL